MCGVLCLVLALYCVSWCIFEFSYHLGEEERAVDYLNCVVVVCSVCLPHGAISWSAVSDSSIC